MRKAVAGVLLVVAAGAFWFAGRPAYHRYKENRALSHARDFLARQDYRNASLSARQALAANPRSLEACRLMAGLAELARSPQVLDWQRRILELSPTVEDKLLLAVAALRVQSPPYPLAAQTLEELAGPAGGVAAYHVVAAELALKLNQTRQAEDHFEAASHLDPTNELHQLDLAVLRLRSTNATVAAQARASLERLSANTNLAAVVLRWLMADKVGAKDWLTASEVSSRLVANPRSTLEDRLEHLEILRQSEQPGLEEFLAATRSCAATNPAAIYTVSSWMAGHGLAGEAMRWLTNLPARLQAEQPVPLAKVDCYFVATNWIGLQSFLEGEQWGETEFLRLAFLSRAAAGQGDRLAVEGQWRLAVRQTGDRLGPLVALLNLAAGWGREDAREDLLWRITQRFPHERWALHDLRQIYIQGGNTRALNKVAAALASADPKDFASRNDLAGTAMLLKLNLPKAYQSARDLYREHPDQPVIAATYAYSLHLQGQSADGLAVMERLKPEALEDPSLALYYAVLLGATGQTSKANHYLALTLGAKLLPEETKLAAQTRKGL